MDNQKHRHGLAGILSGLLGLCLIFLSGQAFSAPPNAARPGGIGGTGVSFNANPGGIGGTGIIAIGPIQRFGSIFVLGKEYHFTPQTRFLRDGQPSAEEAQQLGDWVTVQGHWQNDRWVADQVDMTHAITGTIESIDSTNQRIRVLGQEIMFAPNTQIHAEPHHVALYFSTLKVGDKVRLSAAPGRTGLWLATALVRLNQPSNAVTLQLQGHIGAISPDRKQIQIEGEWFPIAGTIPPGLKINQAVIVRGQYRQDKPIISTIELIKPLNFAPGQAIELFGYAQHIEQTNYCDAFQIKADAGTLGLSPNHQNPAPGTWQVIRGSLIEPNVIEL
ncbi:MAG: DUF5666 domain-containing protein, partial [Halothiobacillus sp.]